MKEDYPQQRSSALVWVLCALVAGFLLQNILLRWLGAGEIVLSFLALSPDAISSYRIWTLVTYSLLHNPDNLLHILFVLISLYFIGREVLETIGTRRFLGLYVASALVGAVVWLGLHWNSGGVLIGATAAVTGVFFLFVCLNPDRPITFLLLFIPITLPKTKYLGYAVAAFECFGLAFWEFGSDPPSIAHSAHLGGMLTGLAYYRFVHRSFRWPRFFGRGKVEVIPPAWTKKATVVQGGNVKFQVDIRDKGSLKAEVDRILDKINSKGFASLTEEEKRILDQARDLLNRN